MSRPWVRFLVYVALVIILVTSEGAQARRRYILKKAAKQTPWHKTHICAEREWKTIKKKQRIVPSNADHPFFGSLVYCESSALDYATTGAGLKEL
uniref:Secreted protein n=1 Tax=Timema poppense TaxID=170557 RepID=A0A7R9HCW8_TIMPO|nr:unnamed protein product [Timema poppensis]